MPRRNDSLARIAALENGNAYELDTPYGGVTQAITTTAGQLYDLNFATGSDPSNGAYAGPVSVNSSAGAAAEEFTLDPTLGAGN